MTGRSKTNPGSTYAKDVIISGRNYDRYHPSNLSGTCRVSVGAQKEVRPTIFSFPFLSWFSIVYYASIICMYTSLRVKKQTHERLARHGRVTSSFDDVLNELMDIAEGEKKP